MLCLMANVHWFINQYTKWPGDKMVFIEEFFRIIKSFKVYHEKRCFFCTLKLFVYMSHEKAITPCMKTNLYINIDDNCDFFMVS